MTLLFNWQTLLFSPALTLKKKIQLKQWKYFSSGIFWNNIRATVLLAGVFNWENLILSSWSHLSSHKVAVFKPAYLQYIYFLLMFKGEHIMNPLALSSISFYFMSDKVLICCAWCIIGKSEWYAGHLQDNSYVVFEAEKKVTYDLVNFHFAEWQERLFAVLDSGNMKHFFISFKYSHFHE